MPKGFPVDHAVQHWLRQKHWYMECHLDAKLLTSPRLAVELARRFELMGPLVEFLDRPFAQKPKPRKMLFPGF
jgi:uncharacterized protein (DUF2461 family)